MIVKRLHDDDVALVWKRVQRWRFLSEVHFDEEDHEYWLTIRAPLFTFQSHGRGFRFNADGAVEVTSDRAVVFIEYYPRFRSNVRFDKTIWATDKPNSQSSRNYKGYTKDDPTYTHLTCVNPTLVQEYGAMLSKYGRLSSRI